MIIVISENPNNETGLFSSLCCNLEDHMDLGWTTTLFKHYLVSVVITTSALYTCSLTTVLVTNQVAYLSHWALAAIP